MIRLNRGITRISRGFNALAGAAVVVMMLLTCADVLLRLLRRPIPGTYEIIGFLGTVVISFSLAYTSLEKGHIAVEILVEKLPRRVQVGVEAVTSLIGAALFALITWQSLVYAADLQAERRGLRDADHADLPLHLRDCRRKRPACAWSFWSRACDPRSGR